MIFGLKIGKFRKSRASTHLYGNSVHLYSQNVLLQDNSVHQYSNGVRLYNHSVILYSNSVHLYSDGELLYRNSDLYRNSIPLYIKYILVSVSQKLQTEIQIHIELLLQILILYLLFQGSYIQFRLLIDQFRPPNMSVLGNFTRQR